MDVPDTKQRYKIHLKHIGFATNFPRFSHLAYVAHVAHTAHIARLAHFEHLARTAEMDERIWRWLQGMPHPQEQHKSLKRARSADVMVQNTSSTIEKRQMTEVMLDPRLGEGFNPEEAAPRSLEYTHVQSPECGADNRSSSSLRHSQASHFSHASSAESPTLFNQKCRLHPSKSLAELALLGYPVHQQTVDLPNKMPEPLGPSHTDHAQDRQGERNHTTRRQDGSAAPMAGRRGR